MNFKKFRDIGDSEPRAWNPSVGTRFNPDDDEDDNEIPVPYDDEDEDIETDEEDELLEENETETETESVGSVTSGPVKRLVRRNLVSAAVCVVLQEELDFKDE
jgi:hypothetical protein